VAELAQCRIWHPTFAAVDDVGVGTFVFQYYGAGGFSILAPENAAIPFRTGTATAGMENMSCVFGPGLSAFLQRPAGLYTFVAPPRLEPALITFQDKHRVNTVSGTGPGSVPVNGRVYVEEGHNCQAGLNYYLNMLKVSAIRGAGQGVDCTRLTPDVVLCSEVLLRINGMHANDDGDRKSTRLNSSHTT
jgi:hypothetical protein